MNNRNMKKCPTCGFLLYGRLVDAINNPFMNESCPKDVGKKVKKKREVELRDPETKLPSLQTLALLGSMMNETKEM